MRLPYSRKVYGLRTMSRPLIYLDTETGGLDPRTVDILTFGALVVHPDGKEEEFYYELSLPEYRVESKAMEINGLDLKELQKNGLSEYDFWFKIYSLLKMKDAVFIGQNIVFDDGFISPLYLKYTRNARTPVMRNHIDTKALALNAMVAGKIPFGSTALKDLIAYFNLDGTGHHNALRDCYLARQVHLALNSL